MSKEDFFTEMKLTEQQQRAAQGLMQGPVLYAYLDGRCIRMETQLGRDPWVWRNDQWKPMRLPK